MLSSGSMGSRSEGASPDNRKRGGASLPFFMAEGQLDTSAAQRPGNSKEMRQL